MNPSEKNPAADEPRAHAEVHEVLVFFKTYGRAVGIGVLAAILLILGVSLVKGRRDRQNADANALLSGATTPEQLSAIGERYPRSSAAALATLRQGSLLAGQGRWDEALKTYEHFRTAYPNHFFRPAADLNIALCLESLARGDEALKAYEVFEAANGQHYLLPLATLGRGRCESLAGRTEEARTIYEDFLAAHPKSSWTVQAEAALQSLTRPAGKSPKLEVLPESADKKLDAGPDVLHP